MIIKRVIIENYLCYSGINEFDFSPGLNVIIGENGEGKTKFFEAIQWLFQDNVKDLETLIAAKAKSELIAGESFRVSVKILFEQFNESNLVEKYFEVSRTLDGLFEISNASIIGIEENKEGERTLTDGALLLERLFPIAIRRYSMFKGETELNIFKNEDALINLVNLFSSAKYFDKYLDKSIYLSEKAEQAVKESTKSAIKNQQEYKKIELDIQTQLDNKNKYSRLLETTQKQLSEINTAITEAEKYVNNAKALETVNTRIKNIENRISEKYSLIDENYTTQLFDNKLLLINFEKYHTDFNKKISVLAKHRRFLISEHDINIGIAQGKKLMRDELLNNSIPLPIGVPSRDHLEEMIEEELCKVCNRPAEKGSPAYEFMLNRLKEYLDTQIPIDKDEEDDILFANNYIDKLHTLATKHEDELLYIRNIRNNIKELFEFNNARKVEIQQLDIQLELEKEERNKIIGKSSLAGEDLENVLKNYSAWQTDFINYSKNENVYKDKISTIEVELARLKKLKDEIDIKSANTFLINTRNILTDIELIFKETKDRKFSEFIDLLQGKSNDYFESINTDSFTGKIDFNKRKHGNKIIIDQELLEESGAVYSPNQSLLTSMHISILFAISELSKGLNDDESYPLILDAPTSSFGETKTAEFLNLIYSTSQQKILLTKDFVEMNETNRTLSIKESFNSVKKHKAFWVRLVRPFDNKNLSTIKSEVIKIYG